MVRPTRNRVPPVVVKIEREDVDDAFAKRYISDSGGEDNDDAKDDNWSPDEEKGESAPKKSTRRKTPAKKKTPRGSGGGSRSRPRSKMSSEEFREKENERKRLARLRKKEENRGSGGGDSGSRCRSKLTDEEFKAKERERKRLARLRQKEQKNLRNLDETKVKTEPRDQSEESARSRTFGGRRKRMSEMTPEELQAHRELDLERRKAKRASLTPEELEEKRAKERERARLKRARAREGLLPDEKALQIEIQKEKDRERKRARRAAMTPEEKRQENQKLCIYRLIRNARLSDEEKREANMRAYMEKMARLAEMTPEEREAVAQKKRVRARENARVRLQRLRETIGQDKLNERQRNYYHGISPEMRARNLEKQREKYRALKQDPDKWKEFVARDKERRKRLLERRRMNGEELVRRRRVTWGEPKKEAGELKPRRRRVATVGRKWREMTEEQKEKIREYNRQRDLKKKLAIQVLLDSGMTMEEIREKTETPEKRQRRCILSRIRKARADLKARLERCGASPEEIKRQEEELKRTYQPNLVFFPYKPRPERWKRVGSQDIAKLAADGKLGDLEKHQPSAILEKLAAKTFSSIATSSQTSGPTTTQAPEPAPKKRGRQAKPKAQPSTSVPMATTSQGYPHMQPQQQYQAPSAYHSSYMYPHQQPQTPAHSGSLQHVLDAINFQESACSSSYTNTIPGAYHQDPHSSTSSQHDYNSSYNDDVGDYANYSPPPTPGGGHDSVSDINLHNSTSCHNQYTYPPQQPPLQGNPPRKFHDPNGTGRKKKYVYVPPKNPNAKLRVRKNDPSKTHICDTCGRSFASAYSLSLHQKQLHNPNYDLSTRTCVLCNQHFKHAQTWYSHFVNAHPQPSKVDPSKTHMCDACGQGFANQYNLNNHQYYTHGDGLKPENHLRCPVCPQERLFTRKLNLNAHLQKCHPGYQKIYDNLDCYRCDKNFPNSTVMRAHVRACHPTSFFPCVYCEVTRFSKLGLHLHYNRCPKIPKEEKVRRREEDKMEGGFFGVDDLNVACELCGRMVTLPRLIYHYDVVHGVKEEAWRCGECGKEFKRREFWAVHLEERHGIPVLERREMLGRLNKEDREGVSVTPLPVKKGGFVGRGEEKKGGNEDGVVKLEGKKKRKVRVIAEEDEMFEKQLSQLD